MNLFDRAKVWYNTVGMPDLPKLPDGSELSSLLVSTDPEAYVYGDPVVLAWIKSELMRKGSQGMPQDPLSRMPKWR